MSCSNHRTHNRICFVKVFAACLSSLGTESVSMLYVTVEMQYSGFGLQMDMKNMSVWCLTYSSGVKIHPPSDFLYFYIFVMLHGFRSSF